MMIAVTSSNLSERLIRTELKLGNGFLKCNVEKFRGLH